MSSSTRKTGGAAQQPSGRSLLGTGAFSTGVIQTTNQKGQLIARKQTNQKNAGFLANQVATYLELMSDPISQNHISRYLCHGDLFLQMQRIPGAIDLEKILTDPTLMPSMTRLNWARTACSIIEAVLWLHSKGIAHCDIKPANILIVPGNPPTARLIDFGFSIRGDRTEPASGTIKYMPADMIQKFQAKQHVNLQDGFAYDYWALGIVLMRIIGGFTTDPLMKYISDEFMIRNRKSIDLNDKILKHVNDTLQKSFRIFYDMNLLDPNPAERRLVKK